MRKKPILLDKQRQTTMLNMWGLYEKMKTKEGLTDAEKAYFNSHLRTIKDYYRTNGMIWFNQKPLINTRNNKSAKTSS